MRDHPDAPVMLDAYRPVNTTVACRCGGFLSAPKNDEARVRLEVERHQHTLTHVTWAAAQDFPPRTESGSARVTANGRPGGR